MSTQTKPHGSSSHRQLCEYASKRCKNERAFKLNGDRHKLCFNHRQLANDNQRRWHTRKKRLQHSAKQSPATSPTPDTGVSKSEANGQYLLATEHTGHAQRGQTMPPLRYTPPHSSSLPAPILPLPYQNDPCVLPRLRQHHVLSHALLLPVSPYHGVSAEFGGIPRRPQPSFSLSHVLLLPGSPDHCVVADGVTFGGMPFQPHPVVVRRETSEPAQRSVQRLRLGERSSYAQYVSNHEC